MATRKKIICSGGGTLGSVTPLLAVVNELKKSGVYEFEWWGTETGPEKDIAKSFGLKYKAISSGKFRRYFSLSNVFDIIRIFFGFLQSLWHFGLNKPAAILTAGGYVAVPVGYAAYLYNVPVFVHQEDIRPGLANRLLLPVASLITVTFEKSLADYKSAETKFVGNPVREEFLNKSDKVQAREKLGLNPKKTTLLFMGGGTGSEFLNNLVWGALPILLEKFQIIHITGVGKMDKEFNNSGYLSMEITAEIYDCMSAADVVVSRAGLATISELSALSKPSIIIPLFGTHQEENAVWLSEKKSAVVLNQADLTPDKLIATLDELLSNQDKMNYLGRNIYTIMPKNSAELIAKEVVKYL